MSTTTSVAPKPKRALPPLMSLSDAAAERLRGLIAGARIDATPDLDIQVTASFGVAELVPAFTDPESWFAATDVLLYAAKRRGRNRCIALFDEAFLDA